MNSFSRSMLVSALRRLFGYNPQKYYSLIEYMRRIPGLTLSVGERSVRLSPESYWEYTRFQRILSKEPETIAWINGFAPDSVLWDIGANVGVYSVYAALRHPSVRLLAVEPEPANVIRLAANLATVAPERSIAIPMGMAGETGVFFLERSCMIAGSNANQLTSKAGGFGCAGFSIDDLVRLDGIPFPSYLKIDVDGIEISILAGATATLADPRLRSVLVEAQDAAAAAAIDATMIGAGFAPCDMPQVQGNRIYVKTA